MSKLNVIARATLERSIFILAAISFMSAAWPQAYAQTSVKVGYAPFAVPLAWLPNATPENYRSLDGNTAQGAMVDIYKAVAKEIGLTLQFVCLVSGELPEAQRSEKIDIRIVDASSAGKEGLAATAPIYNDSEILIANASDGREYKTWDDLRGQVIGSRIGSVYDDDLKKAGLQVKSYAAAPDLYGVVNSGEIKVAINTTYVATAYALQQGRYPNIRIVKTYQVRYPRLSAIGARNEQKTLIADIDVVLAKLKTNGTANSIFTNYGIGGALVK